MERAGGIAVLTRADHPSGSDRIFEAVEAFDPEGRHDIVVNVQGDLPTIDPRAVQASILPSPIPKSTSRRSPSRSCWRRNAPIPTWSRPSAARLRPGRMRALYFTRATAPSGEGPLYHHVGLYAYRRRALARFVSLPPSPLEKRERLEQLRAIENGMRIDIVVVDDVPLGVDTPHDLERARTLLAARPKAH